MVPLNGFENEPGGGFSVNGLFFRKFWSNTNFAEATGPWLKAETFGGFATAADGRLKVEVSPVDAALVREEEKEVACFSSEGEGLSGAGQGHNEIGLVEVGNIADEGIVAVEKEGWRH